MTETDRKKAEVLSGEFAKVFTNEPNDTVPEFESKPCCHPFPELKITEKIVQKKLEKLNPKKSPGPDGIHPRVLKEAAEILAKPLTLLFKKSILREELPHAWKIGYISAIFKKGDRNEALNY